MTGNVENRLTDCDRPANSPVYVRLESETIFVPPDRAIKPISERQFHDLVRGYQAVCRDGVMVYAREGKPWKYERKGHDLVVRHDSYPLPVEQFYIV
jgi:hypothetical protein